MASSEHPSVVFSPHRVPFNLPITTSHRKWTWGHTLRYSKKAFAPGSPSLSGSPFLVELSHWAMSSPWLYWIASFCLLWGYYLLSGTCDGQDAHCIASLGWTVSPGLIWMTYSSLSLFLGRASKKVVILYDSNWPQSIEGPPEHLLVKNRIPERDTWSLGCCLEKIGRM